MKSTVIVKTFGLLEATARAGGERSLAELASEARLSKPTAHRILSTLTALGYIEKTAVGQYRQSSQIQRLLTGTDDKSLRALAEPILQRLYKSTGETVNLGVLRNGRVVYLEVLESRKPLRRVVAANSTDPFHCTALGRAIVSQLPLPQRELLLRTNDLNKCTAHTITDLEQLRQIFNRAAKIGYVIEQDETDIGVTCVAAPVLDKSIAVAAISLSVPSPRIASIGEPSLIKAVCVAATKLTNLIAKGGVANRWR